MTARAVSAVTSATRRDRPEASPMTEHGFWPGSFLAALARGTHRALPVPPTRHRAETAPDTIGGGLRPQPPHPPRPEPGLSRPADPGPLRYSFPPPPRSEGSEC